MLRIISYGVCHLQKKPTSMKKKGTGKKGQRKDKSTDPQKTQSKNNTEEENEEPWEGSRPPRSYLVWMRQRRQQMQRHQQRQQVDCVSGSRLLSAIRGKIKFKTECLNYNVAADPSSNEDESATSANQEKSILKTYKILNVLQPYLHAIELSSDEDDSDASGTEEECRTIHSSPTTKQLSKNC